MDVVRAQGLDAALTDMRAEISADLRARQAKLYILGHKDLANELGDLLADYPTTRGWRMTISALKNLSWLPLVRIYAVAHAANGFRKTLRLRKS